MSAGLCIAHLQLLNLPRLGRDSYWELLLATTGPFVLRRAMGILTSTRCIELLDLREAGRLGTLRQYHNLCQLLPQVEQAPPASAPAPAFFSCSSLFCTGAEGLLAPARRGS